MSDIQTAEDQFEGARQAAWKSMGDFATGKTAVEESQNYREMISAFPVAKEPAGLDIEENREQVLRDAADDLTKSRGEDRPDAKPIMVREYTEVGTGKPKAEFETLSVEQASSDLTGARNREENHQTETEAQELARVIDQLRRGDETTESLGVETAQPLPIEQQSQPDVQPQAGDDDWQRHLQDPRVLNAVKQHVEQANAQANQTIQAYNSAAIDAANRSLVGLVTSYPELQGVNAQQLPVALHVIGAQNPQRAQDIVNHIGLINDTVKRGIEAHTAQAQQQYVQYRHQFNSWGKSQDAEYEAYVRHVPASERQAVEEEARRIVLEGSDAQSVALSWHTSPELRSGKAQRALFDAARYRLGEKARESAKRKISHPIPHVQRPGAGNLERASDQDYQIRALNKNGGPLSAKEAAELVLAQRAQRARGR